MERLKVAVIGLGTWGRTHLETYADHPGAELRAVCDLDADVAAEAAERHGVPRSYTDFRVMLSEEDLDAVSIVTPDFTHADIAIAAIRAGVAVLVEKPLATTLEDCDRIGAALEERPVPFMVDFHNRWSPAVVHMQEAVAKGEIGKVQMAYCRLSDTLFVPTQMLSWAGRSSVLWFLGSHCVDTLRWLVGDEIARVYATSASRMLKAKGIDTPDFYLSTLEFRGGARALLENSWILPENRPSLVDFKIELIGSEGAFDFNGAPHRLVRTDGQGTQCPDTFIAPRVHGRRVGFAAESIRDFVRCLLHDRQPEVGFEDGREATRVLLAIEEAARTASPVELA